MKNIKFFFLLFLIVRFLITNSFAQEYFQQEVNYKINVRLDDVNHELFADETIEYINNSPDHLDFIYFHLWPNAYKNNSTALAAQEINRKGKHKLFKIESHRGYIDSLDFKVNGKQIKWEYDSLHIDICKLILNKPLKSGDKIIITTPFYVKIPKGVTSRFGHIEQSYQITQWYPKPAVYDKCGWNQMPYLNMGEFYSEFGSFDVSITLPKNYVVGATGNLMNKDELIWLEQKAEETKIIESFDKKDMDIPPSDSLIKTLRYTEKNIHDFAWFADKRYHVLKGEVELPNTGKKVSTWAMFTNNNAELWKNSLEYINDALYYYSLWYGDYPYNNCSAVLGGCSAGGNMEYPTITVITRTKTPLRLEMTIVHEVGHNWFYGMIGFNERRYTWMDEGINSFSDSRYIQTKYPDNKFYKMFVEKNMAKILGIEAYPYKTIHEFQYLLAARNNIDQPANLHSEDYILQNYAAIAYCKTALSFHYLMNYLGEEKFNEIMQEFFKKWQYKHPYPEDIRKIFEEKTKKNLDWFFDDILKTTKKIDYKIKKTNNDKILIKNLGQINSPVSISGITNDSVFFTKWYEGFEGEKWLIVPEKNVDKLEIDYSEKMLELYRKNNSMKTSGIFKKLEPIKFQSVGIFENPDNTQIDFLPAFGWNNYNKYMLGALFHNGIFPIQKFDYQLVPFYSFGTNDFAGSGKISYNIYPYNTCVQRLTLSLSASQYAFNEQQGNNFQKIKTEASFTFKKQSAKSSINNYINIKSIAATDITDILYNSETSNKFFHNIEYIHFNKRKINPYMVFLNIQGSNNFVKSSLEVTYKISYYKQRGLDIRLFGGTFLYHDKNMSGIYNFSLRGSSGNQDYLYDNIFLGRFENIETNNNSILARQFVKNDGGFAIYTPFGQTNDWLLALNLTSSLPFDAKIPVKLYANFAAFGNALQIQNYPDVKSFAYETGVIFSIINDVFEIYFPFIVSEDINNYSNEITDNYWQKVRFILNINELNLFNFIKQM
ncbi:MAG: M1 family metallopeptidase [Bacteroidales bacterium]|nr:M1 family metallopeptidase [Bacteroidales bacterium]